MLTMRRMIVPSILLSRHSPIRPIASTSHHLHNDQPESVSIRQQNKTLSFLVRRGRLDDARKLFDSIPCRTTVTWNSMLYGYVRHRHLALALHLFDHMPHRDLVSWNTILLGYATSLEAGEFRHARKLFDEMPHRDAVSWNTMIRGYVLNGRMEDALLLFDVMPERNTVSWNTIITGFLEGGYVKEAVKMFQRMPMGDPSSLSALVAGLVRNGKLDDAECVLVDWCKMGKTEGILDAYNTLIAGYGHCGEVEKARRIFEMIPNKLYQGGIEDGGMRGFCKNIISWNTMMMCYVEAGDICEARRLFDKMPKRDLISWNTMIKGYIRVMEIEHAASLFEEMRYPDDRTWNFMITGYARRGDVEKARGYFDQMPRRNVVSWNTMIAGYEQNADYEGAIWLFTEMQGVGEGPDRHTLSSVLGACAGLASVNLGRQIHQHITKTFTQDTPISNSLITMYARCGDLVSARCVFDDIETPNDFITWNAMIGSYAQHGLAADALNLFYKMKNLKVKPTHITFISVLTACCYSGLVAEGQREFNSMVHEIGIMPGVEHYALLVNLLGRHGRLEEAMAVINGMLVPPDKSVWGALLDACKIHKNCDLARIAAEALMLVDPDSAGPYVLLYNMYVGLGRWEEAIEVREILDKNRIKKQPGCSWIELQGGVENFVAGDRSHPLASEIYDVIKSHEKIVKDQYNWDDELYKLRSVDCT